MSTTEQVLARLRSEGTYSTLTASAILAAILFLPTSSTLEFQVVPPQRPEYKAIETSGSSFPVCRINFWEDTEKPSYRPKTALGKRLLDLRKQAIAKGLVLLNREEIIDEVRSRRGEVA